MPPNFQMPQDGIQVGLCFKFLSRTIQTLVRSSQQPIRPGVPHPHQPDGVSKHTFRKLKPPENGT